MVLPICAMEFFNKSWPENFICNFDAFDKLTIETAIDSHWKDPEKLCQPGPYPKRCTYTTDEPWGKKNQTLIIYIHYERLKDRTGDFKSADWKIGHHVGKKFVIDHEQARSLFLPREID